MKNTTKNFMYNLLYQVFVFLIPLITVPYVSRVLGPNNIGVYSFTYSIVYYFMLGAMLGINNYGSREIAKINDKKEISKKFWSIYLLQLFCSIIMLILYAILCLTIDYNYKNILIIQVIYLISCAFDINWFFWGKEKFKITITRNILLKILSLILIFIFVKNENDLWIYTLILAISTLLSQIYLWIPLRKEVKFERVSVKEIFSNLKPVLILFVPIIAYSIYRVMDKTMIGTFSNSFQLGNYESAEKILNIPLSIITALCTVMMPHMSKQENENEKSTEIIKNTYKICAFCIYPIIMGIFAVCNEFCTAFFGMEFSLTPTIIKVLLITVLFSCISNITRSTYLIPNRKDKIYVKSTVFGAIINLILNILLIKRFGAYGACVGTIAAEFVVMFYQVIKTKEYIEYTENIKSTMPFLIKSIIMGIVLVGIGIVVENLKIKLIIQIISGIAIYVILNIKYIKQEFFCKKQN